MTPTEKDKSDNELIAEFMGAYWPEHPKNEYDSSFLYKDNKRWLQVDALKYNTSWDWLMPVVEKIENTEVVSIETVGLGEKMNVQINKRFCKIWFPFENDKPLITEIRNTKIEAVYKGVIRWIKWYNNTHKDGK
ncbi:MAG TPA: hypothetical protein VM101_13535 [Flavitalea sp.]|nr:hypothetical protein [Flavitalea sp.]